MEKGMEGSGCRLCPVCGEEIHGRADKKFCSDDCRVHFNNERYRKRQQAMTQNRDLSAINSNAMLLCGQNAKFLLKFLLATSQLCKILYTFGGYISKKLSRYDKSCFCIIITIICSSHFLR